MPPARVLIREHLWEDLAAYLDWQCDPLMAQYLSWLPRSREAAEASLRDAIAQQSAVERQRYFYAIVSIATGEVLGDVGFTLEDEQTGHCGWFLRRAYQGQGYGSEAVHLMVKHAFESVGLTRLNASCLRKNQGSRRIMEKCGFRLLRENETRLWYVQTP